MEALGRTVEKLREVDDRVVFRRERLRAARHQFRNRVCRKLVVPTERLQLRVQQPATSAHAAPMPGSALRSRHLL